MDGSIPSFCPMLLSLLVARWRLFGFSHITDMSLLLTRTFTLENALSFLSFHSLSLFISHSLRLFSPSHLDAYFDFCFSLTHLHFHSLFYFIWFARAEQECKWNSPSHPFGPMPESYHNYEYLFLSSLNFLIVYAIN